MKTTLKKAGALGILGVSVLGVMSASAMGYGQMMSGTNLSPDEVATRQTASFTKQASMIGASLDEVKNAWSEGKSFKTLAKEKGVTEEQLKAKMDTQRISNMKAHLSALVSKGVITQAQADKRLAFMKTNTNKIGTKMGKGGMHGGEMGNMMKRF
jgi:ribosomal protein L14E/L6E/L27E